MLWAIVKICNRGSEARRTTLATLDFEYVSRFLIAAFFHAKKASLG
jgi:hypothetical protein